jgi:transposase-like protein
MNATVKNSKMARRYGEEFKRQAVELMIHGGKTQRQVARELDVSGYSLNLWKKAYLGQQKPAEINGEVKSPEEMAKIIPVCGDRAIVGSIWSQGRLFGVEAATVFRR